MIHRDKLNRKKEKNIENKKKGDYGEKNVIFHLQHLEHSDETPFRVINGKSFSFKGHVQAQIDHIVICRKGVFLLETKNHEASIVVTKSGDWLKRNKDGKLSPYWLDPTSQCTMHHTIIRNILYSSGYPEAPIIDFIVLANRSQHIYNAEYSMYRIVKVDKLLEIFTVKDDEFYPDVLSNEQIEGIYNVLKASEVESKSRDINVLRSLLKKMVRLPITYALISSVLVFLILLGFSVNVLITNSFLFKEPKIICASSDISVFRLRLGSNNANDALSVPSETPNKNVDNAAQNNNAEDTDMFQKTASLSWEVISNKTYLGIKDGKKTILSSNCTKGTKVYFYNDKTITIIKPDGSEKIFTVENDILDLEVANNYTEVYHNGNLRKSLRQFRYDIVNNEIIK